MGRDDRDVGARWSIQRAALLLVLALGLPLLSAAAYLGYRAYRSDKLSAEEQLYGLAGAAAMGIHEFLRASERLLAGMASDPRLAALDPALCPLSFPGLSHAFGSVYADLGTWRLDGTPACSREPSPPGLTVLEAPGFKEGLEAGGLHVAPVQRGKRTGRWSAVLTYPIRDPSGTPVGLVSAAVDLVRFQEILNEMNSPEDGVLTLFQSDKVVVARSRDPTGTIGAVADAPGTPMAGAHPETRERGLSRALTLNGEDFTWAFVRVPDADWIVFAGRPTAKVYGPVWAFRFRLYFGLAALVALALVLAVAVYRSVSRPLEALVTGIGSASPTDAAPLPLAGPREVAWVAEQFNQVWKSRADAEREQARSAERVRALVDNAVTGIFVCSTEGRFVEVNQALVEILGYASRAELLEVPLPTIFDSAEAMERLDAEHAESGSFEGVPARWRRKDGTEVHVRLFGRRVTLEGGGRGWEIIVDDITAFSNLQAQYLQAQKMEALGRLAGGVAHDFNNILTVVQGEASLLLGEEALRSDFRAQVEEIHRAAVSGAGLNRQLLAFGRRALTPKRPLNLNHVVQNFGRVIRKAVREGVEVRLALAPELRSVLADGGQIEQILMNLAMNAADAMPSGGRVTLKTFNVGVTPEEATSYSGASPGAHVVLSVSDTGKGIAPEVLPRVFEPFFSTKPLGKGTGLGLATVYGIVTDLGGHIRVRSEPGAGTTFDLYLPSDDAPAVPEERADTGVVPLPGSGVILLVEDEGGVRRLTRRILERAGYQVLAAPDGIEALRLAEAREGSIDVLVTDVVMPGLRGPQVARELVATGRIRRALFLSGYPEGFTASDLDAALTWRFLPKPFTAADLLDAVERLLASE